MSKITKNVTEKKILTKKSKIAQKVNKNERKENFNNCPEPEITTFYEVYEVLQPPILIQNPYYMQTSYPSNNIMYSHNQRGNHYCINEFCNCDCFRNNNFTNEPEPIIEEPDSDNEVSPDLNLPKSISTPDIRNKM